MNEIVGKRSIPNGKKGAVVIKLDVEVKVWIFFPFKYTKIKSFKTQFLVRPSGCGSAHIFTKNEFPKTVLKNIYI